MSVQPECVFVCCCFRNLSGIVQKQEVVWFCSNKKRWFYVPMTSSCRLCSGAVSRWCSNTRVSRLNSVWFLVYEALGRTRNSECLENLKKKKKKIRLQLKAERLKSASLGHSQPSGLVPIEFNVCAFLLLLHFSETKFIGCIMAYKLYKHYGESTIYLDIW